MADAATAAVVAQPSSSGKTGTHVNPPKAEKQRLPPGATYVTKRPHPKKRKSTSSVASSNAGSIKQARSNESIAKAAEAWKEKQFPPLPAGKRQPYWHKDGLSLFPEPDYLN